MMLDTNVVIDLREKESRWFDWASRVLAGAGEPLVVSAIVVGELAARGGAEGDIRAMLDGIGIRILSVGAEVSYRAGLAQRAYRQAGGTREYLLGDFLIGAHAESSGATLVTRDPRRYRTYFPDLALITPETHP